MFRKETKESEKVFFSAMKFSEIKESQNQVKRQQRETQRILFVE
jgi:hypothetical protein